MHGPLVFLTLLVVLGGCAQGRWVKSDADSEQTQRDFSDCEIMSSVQRPPATLAEKRGAYPDLSSMQIEKCMKSKGYQWVTDDAQSPQQEILEIAPFPDQSNK